MYFVLFFGYGLKVVLGIFGILLTPLAEWVVPEEFFWNISIL